MKKLRTFPTLLIMAIVIVGTNLFSTCDTVVPVTGVTLNKSTLSLEVGGSETLVATVQPENATNKNVTWSSSDTSVATVDAEGKVSALKAGEATITVTTEDGGKSAACAVTVKEATISVTGVALNKSTLSLEVGGSETLVATVQPENATNKNVTWSSSDTSVATVDAEGKVSAIKVGEATITVTTEDGGKSATCAVTVLANLAIDKSEVEVAIGKTATVNILSGSGDYSVESNNAGIATATLSGTVVTITGITAGNTTVTIKDSATDQTKTVTVKVTHPNLAIDRSEVEVATGISATVNILSGSGDYSVESNNAGIATATLSGTVVTITGIALGNTTVTIRDSATDQTKTVTVKVTHPNLAIDKSEVEVATGISATVNILSGSGNYSVESNNAGIATVTLSGIAVTITGIALGNTTVTVKDNATNQTKTVAVKVTHPDLVIDKSEVEVATGISATVNILSGSGDYSVDSNNVGIATATLSGTVVTITGIALGNTTVTIKDNATDQTKTVTVKVTHPDLTIDKSKVEVETGISATVNILSGSGNYSVESNNAGIATATLSGTVVTITGIALGNTTVTVKDNVTNQTKTVTVKVTTSSIVMTTSKVVGSTISIYMYANPANQPGVWIDLNNNGTMDNGEKVTNFNSITTYTLGAQTVTIYGKVTTLDCPHNQLTSLNVSNNAELTRLDCPHNQLTSLNVSNNAELTDLYCHNNQLTSLNVSNNVKLTELSCHGNPLTSLNVSNNAELTRLYCNDNQLTSLNVSNNAELTTLHCYHNQLTSLNVSNNVKLIDLYCQDNQLTSLNVSNNAELTILYCHNNQLTSLNVSNNAVLGELSCFNNQLTSLNVSNNVKLTRLDCYKNQLTSLDASNNAEITTLSCFNNQLTSLNVSNSVKLTRLYCNKNQLTSLDVSNNVELTTLYCHNNQLTSLIVNSDKKQLKELYCYNNKINKVNMGALINSMPTHPASDKGKFYPRSTHAGEQNVFEKYHKVKAEAKNWEVYIGNW